MAAPTALASALAAWLYYGDQAEYVGLDHGDVQTVDDWPPLQGRTVYILDFSFSAEILTAIDERAAKLVMLDHHRVLPKSSRALHAAAVWCIST